MPQNSASPTKPLQYLYYVGGGGGASAEESILGKENELEMGRVYERVREHDVPPSTEDNQVEDITHQQRTASSPKPERENPGAAKLEKDSYAHIPRCIRRALAKPSLVLPTTMIRHNFSTNSRGACGSWTTVATTAPDTSTTACCH